ncbi:MAG TPA: glucose-6-phosphate dehydrogenase [Thermoanaerobaculia bacterium]|nr:glucose-6-phosphate dehydrogenase [Thermoanaerobaculia bacterium]
MRPKKKARGRRGKTAVSRHRKHPAGGRKKPAAAAARPDTTRQPPKPLVSAPLDGTPAAPEPCAMVIFGASGDLTARMLMPALAKLAKERALPDGFFAVGVSRSPMTDAGFRTAMQAAVAKFSTDPLQVTELPPEFLGRLHYVTGEFHEPATYRRLKTMLAKARRKGGAGCPENHVFYLATPPDVDPVIVDHLGRAGLAREETGCFSRVVVEKPFGHDLESARALNAEIHRVFREDQIFRIDHYLGKETVQNILVLRFANGIFEPLWNRRYIDNVQIAVAESLGVGHRAGYYESAGVVRDMSQNHLLQLLCLTAMEAPVRLDAESVRGEKVKVLRSIRPIPPDRLDESAVRGQYGPGVVGGEEVAGYRQEPGVSRQSATPTYAAVRFFIDNWRWAGVPFYLRSGKRLEKRMTEIAIEFRDVPHTTIFLKEPGGSGRLEKNVLRLKIQPDEGISLKFLAKIPGAGMRVTPESMDFPYDQLGAAQHGGYERLLLDIMHGDATLFTRGDEVEEAWRVVMPILEGWEKTKPRGFPNYPAGTMGPEVAANTFIEGDGRHWRKL